MEFFHSGSIHNHNDPLDVGASHQFLDSVMETVEPHIAAALSSSEASNCSPYGFIPPSEQLPVSASASSVSASAFNVEIALQKSAEELSLSSSSSSSSSPSVLSHTLAPGRPSRVNASALRIAFEKSQNRQIPTYDLKRDDYLLIEVHMEHVLWQVTSILSSVATITALDYRRNLPDRQIHWKTQNYPLTNIDRQVIMAKARLSAVGRFRALSVQSFTAISDGNCFVVSALTHFDVEISRNSIQELRSRVARYVRENPDFAAKLAEYFFDSPASMNSHFSKVESNSNCHEWFQDATVFAFARAYDCDCVVLTLNSDGDRHGTATTYASGAENQPPKFLFTLITDSNNNGHFEPAKPLPLLSLSDALAQFVQARYTITAGSITLELS